MVHRNVAAILRAAECPLQSCAAAKGTDTMWQDSLGEMLWIGTALFALIVAASPMIAWYFHP